MSKHMQRDLEKLQKQVLQMAGLVEEAVFRAARALRENDGDAAREVIAGDAAIDEFENAVQEECLKVLALHQPVAVDLRRICTILLISTDLERMGDLAVGIAERAVMLETGPRLPMPPRLGPMTDRAADMVRRALDAFVNLDTAAARQVIKLDDAVDEDNAAIIDGIIAAMRQDPAMIEPGIALFSAVRHLERIADHATNISEDVIYTVEGEVVRHRHEAL